MSEVVEAGAGPVTPPPLGGAGGPGAGNWAGLTLDSPEWPALNARRAELIRQKNHGAGLTPAESAEFEELQELADRVVLAAHPIFMPFTPQELALIESKAGPA